MMRYARVAPRLMLRRDAAAVEIAAPQNDTRATRRVADTRLTPPARLTPSPQNAAQRWRLRRAPAPAAARQRAKRKRKRVRCRGSQPAVLIECRDDIRRATPLYGRRRRKSQRMMVQQPRAAMSFAAHHDYERCQSKTPRRAVPVADGKRRRDATPAYVAPQSFATRFKTRC